MEDDPRFRHLCRKRDDRGEAVHTVGLVERAVKIHVHTLFARTKIHHPMRANPFGDLVLQHGWKRHELFLFARSFDPHSEAMVVAPFVLVVALRRNVRFLGAVTHVQRGECIGVSEKHLVESTVEANAHRERHPLHDPFELERLFGKIHPNRRLSDRRFQRESFEKKFGPRGLGRLVLRVDFPCDDRIFFEAGAEQTQYAIEQSLDRIIVYRNAAHQHAGRRNRSHRSSSAQETIVGKCRREVESLLAELDGAGRKNRLIWHAASCSQAPLGTPLVRKFRGKLRGTARAVLPSVHMTKRMGLAVFWVAAFGASGCAAPVEEESEESVDESSSALANGTVTSGQRAVVLIYVAGGGLCTGTFIGANVVLTAAHCLRSASPRDYYVYLDNTVASARRVRLADGIRVRAIAENRALASKTLLAEADTSSDVAMLVTEGQPAPAIVELATGGAPEGASLTCVGYGAYAPGKIDYQKRQGAVRVSTPKNASPTYRGRLFYTLGSDREAYKATPAVRSCGMASWSPSLVPAASSAPQTRASTRASTYPR